jgi:hypothetical protein
MSRSGYSDDCENLGLWRGAVNAAAQGARGQKLLGELAAAMDAMTEKALIAEELIAADGQLCALGVLGCARGIGDKLRDLDPEDYDAVSRVFDIAPALAQEIVYQNDEGAWQGRETPEQRWERMRLWVQGQIKAQAAK